MVPAHTNDRLYRDSQPNTSSDDPACLFSGVLAQVRWFALVAILFLAFIEPVPGRTGLPIWSYILVFVGYNLVLEVLRRRVGWLDSFAHVPWFDLPLVAVLYATSTAPGGPLLVLFLLIVSCAAASMPPRRNMVFIALVVAIVALITTTLPFWQGSWWQVRDLGTQLVIICFVGLAVSALTQRLAREQRKVAASQAKNQRRAERDAVRAEVMTMLAHDFHTVLTAAKGGVGLLEEHIRERLDDQERRLVANARHNIARLERHVNDLLALSQLDARILHLTLQPLDLRDVVTAAVLALETAIQAKQQILDVRLPEPLPMCGDAWRLEHAVLNLLWNAHQHTPAETCILITGLIDRQDILLLVSDNGPGVPSADLEQLFTPFHQAGGNTRTTGLGLAIVRGIVELHGGRVWAERTNGTGLAVHIVLPTSRREG